MSQDFRLQGVDSGRASSSGRRAAGNTSKSPISLLQSTERLKQNDRNDNHDWDYDDSNVPPQLSVFQHQPSYLRL
jgi:hypothetical protein